jgi:hypothetical protein
MALGLLALACSSPGEEGTGSGESDGPAPPVVRDSAGITIVESSEPRWGEAPAWCVGELLTSIGTLEGEAPYQLYHALDATRLSDGTVVVGNSSSGELRFFDATGTFVRAVGNNDGGPGEFRGAHALRAVRRVPGDSLITWDIYAQRVSLFAPDGEFVRASRLDGPSAQHFFEGVLGDRSLVMKVFVLGDRSLVMKVFDYGPDEDALLSQDGPARWKFYLLHYDAEYTLADTVGSFLEGDRVQARHGTQGIMITEAPFGRVTSATTHGGKVFVATGDADQVAAYSPSGVLTALIRRDVPPVSMTRELMEEDRARRLAEELPEFERMGASASAMRLLESLPYPSVLPPYGEAVVDREGNLWLEDVRARPDEPFLWSVFDAEGAWLGRVELPQGLQVMEIGGDYILGRSEDELEVERIMVYELLKAREACRGSVTG